ncbi:platelet endothelial cell adhesion molecule isoform X1 [Oryzias latipes]|uniref:platelet endothelial cell adhesion molecule isoform X1 n=1 Tax=Oryzias latipes TaxID=8090 RepID=UPI0005CC0FC8|nr:platelet endothelial cell adhesion molecule isoform X1 [Oryzias latipes]
MGLLLLLASTLLCGCIQSGIVANEDTSFKISSVTLTIEPAEEVPRNTNVTLRCQTKVLTSGNLALTRKYTIFKENRIVHTKMTESSDDVLYLLPEARVSNNGKYVCQLTIEGETLSSQPKKLKVMGLSKPTLHLNRTYLTEGDMVTATCLAPGETGVFGFYFYDDSVELGDVQTDSNRAQSTLHFTTLGLHRLHCFYTVDNMPVDVKSEESNEVIVTVRGLSIKPVLEISPENNVYEGDPLNISCRVETSGLNSENIEVYLSQDGNSRWLSMGKTNTKHRMTATGPQLTFECMMTMEHLKKSERRNVTVIELFSAPVLTMSPAEVFEDEPMTLTCRSEKVASEKLNRAELSYYLSSNQSFASNGSGVFKVKALKTDHTCIAQARGIRKTSKALKVHPKVAVSVPKISLQNKPILEQPFHVLCQSAVGSFPITYILYSNATKLKETVVHLPNQTALFTVVIYNAKELGSYKCEARNGGKRMQSEELVISAIVPLSRPTLTVLPDLSDISEGDQLNLICAVNGTPPVTFRWYREGDKHPLRITTSAETFKDYEVAVVSKQHSGLYYCEAENRASIMVRSNPVDIDVRMALWKKAMIGGIVFLFILLVVTAGCVLHYKSKRGKRERAPELSVKPSSPKSDDSLTVTLTHGTEVYKSASVRVNRSAVSVWTERKPEADNEEDHSTVSNEPDVEYTEVVHPRSAEAARAPLRRGTDTVYSELQNSTHGPPEGHDYGSVEYAELNGEQPETGQNHSDPNRYSDLPEPVD